MSIRAYNSFAELERNEEEFQDYRRSVVIRDSPVSIIAPHGGGIEPGTSEIVEAVSGSEFSLYFLEGIKLNSNHLLHISSIRFDDPVCVQLVEKSQSVVAIHGCMGSSNDVIIGGLDEDLIRIIVKFLATDEFSVIEDHGKYSGTHPNNICNRGKLKRGVQIELTNHIRRAMFRSLKHKDRGVTTPLFDKFVNSIRSALFAAHPSSLRDIEPNSIYENHNNSMKSALLKGVTPMFDEIVRMYSSGRKEERIRADQLIRKNASRFPIGRMVEIQKDSSYSNYEKMAAALALGYHEQSGSKELVVLYKALEDSVGEPTNYGYRVLSAIRKLLSNDVWDDQISSYFGAVNHFRSAGGTDTKNAANAVNELMARGEILEQSPDIKAIRPGKLFPGAKVFIVHGHDHERVKAVARFIKDMKLEPIILHEQASSGDTIIEKLERHGKASYAVILVTPDDLVSSSTDKSIFKPVARQNVILELGYFMGRLGRQRTSALVVEGVELPSDYSGVVYIPMGEDEEWKTLLAREFRELGLDVD